MEITYSSADIGAYVPCRFCAVPDKLHRISHELVCVCVGPVPRIRNIQRIQIATFSV